MKLRADGVRWSQIGRKLGLFPKVCEMKWQAESKKGLKQGAFSAEEDARIREEVLRCGDPRETRGFWTKLEKKMGRRANNLRARWFKTLFLLEEEKRREKEGEKEGEKAVEKEGEREGEKEKGKEGGKEPVKEDDVKPAVLSAKSIISSVKSMWNKLFS